MSFALTPGFSVPSTVIAIVLKGLSGSVCVARIFGEVRRVLGPGGVLLVGFQSGTGERRVERAYGHDIALTAILHEPTAIADALTAAGFEVTAVAERAARGSEKHAQGFVLARRP